MTDTAPMKKCTSCAQSFPNTTEYWPRDARKAAGLGCTCKICISSRNAVQRARRKEAQNRPPFVEKLAEKPYESKQAAIVSANAIARREALARVLAHNASRTYTPKELPRQMSPSRHEPVDLDALYQQPEHHPGDLLLLFLHESGLEIVSKHYPGKNVGHNLYEVVVAPPTIEIHAAMFKIISAAAARAGFSAMPLDRAGDRVAGGYITRYAPCFGSGENRV